MTISLEEHAERLGLDDEERELLADFEKNHAEKPQITEARREELRRIAEASGGKYLSMVKDSVVELAARLKGATA